MSRLIMRVDQSLVGTDKTDVSDSWDERFEIYNGED